MNPNPLPPPEQTEKTLVDEVKGVAKPMLPIAFYICGTIVVIETFLISRIHSGFFPWFPHLFGPLLIAMIPMWFCRNLISQAILIFAAIAYGVWIFHNYWFVIHADNPMASIAFAYAPRIASPILFVLCSIALTIHLWKRYVSPWVVE